ncbi:MAG: 3-phosphoshikimate 1-carboxyvinyltransferase [Anaerovoracaceae bacterium]
MEVRLDNRKLTGTVKVIQSKSFAHRILLAAALSKITSGMETEVKLETVSEDMEATRRVIAAMERGEGVLDCGESGTTLRFMVPVCGALQGRRQAGDATGTERKVRFTGRGRLMQRPMGPLFEAMAPHGVSAFYEDGQLVLTGGLTAGEYSIAANVSSQYISGLLFALPLLEGDSVLNLTGKVESRPYIDITLDVLRQFGIRIEEEEPDAQDAPDVPDAPESSASGGNPPVTCRFRIPGGQVYRGSASMEVEGDWSNAAFWLAAGAAGGGPVTVTGLNLRSVQGDMAICQVLRQFGAEVEEDAAAGSVTCSCPDGMKLHGAEIDVADIPDAVPVLSVVAAAAAGDTRIYNAGRLRIKESDRLQTVTAMLQALGCPVEEGEDFLVIHGQGCGGQDGGKRLTGGTVDGAGDHRIVMSAAVAAAICSGPVVITGAEAVNKSYPGFFREREALWEAHTEKN